MVRTRPPEENRKESYSLERDPAAVFCPSLFSVPVPVNAQTYFAHEQI